MKAVRVFLLTLLICLPTLTVAQSRVERLIEGALSGEGRIVTVRGFSGALSTRSTIDTLTIADDTGIWLTLDQAVLDWDAAALIRGTLSVNELSAAQITILRPPVPAGTSLPDAEAAAFAFPDLPVAVQIGRLSVPELTLGKALLGEEMTLELLSTVDLAGGSGQIMLDANRGDEGGGRFLIKAAFDAATENLSIMANLQEPEGGLVARSLNLPGLPSVVLAINGDGPLDNFAAEIALETAGELRLEGSVTLLRSEQGREFDGALQGDLRALASPNIHPFLGEDAKLEVVGIQSETLGLQLQKLDLSTAQLTLSGLASIGPEGLPERIDLQGQINGQDRVLLPFGDIVLATADISVQFDAAKGADWLLLLDAQDITAQGTSIDQLRLVGSGLIDPAGPTPFDGRLSLRAQGAKFTDPDLARAGGQFAILRTDVRLGQDGQLSASNLILEAENAELRGNVTAALSDTGIATTLNTSLNVPDLSPFSGLLPVLQAGSVSAQLEGIFDLPGGAFDISFVGTSENLDIGISQLAPIFLAPTSIELAARRDENGTQLEKAVIGNKEISITASGAISSEDGGVDVNAQLTNLGVIVPELPGSVTATAKVTDLAKAPQISVQLSSQIGAEGRISGGFEPAETLLSLSGTGRFPLGIANPFLTDQVISGLAEVSLTIDGPPELTSLSGTMSTRNARFSVPSLDLVLAPLSGRVTLGSGRMRVAADAGINGGRVDIDGAVGMSFPHSLEAAVTVSEFGFVYQDVASSTINGQFFVDGAQTTQISIKGQIVLSDTEIRVPETGLSGNAAIPEIRHIGASSDVRRTLERSQVTSGQKSSSASPSMPIDIDITASDPIFVRGRGLDAEFRGGLRILGTVTNPSSVGRFDLVRGRLAFLGQRLDLAEGAITAAGRLIPRIRIVAQTQTGDLVGQIVLDGPADNPSITLSSSPPLPEDEVLSRILFGRDTSSLSPFQIARLVSSIAQLAGRGGAGLVDRIRTKLGVDDLDIRTDAETGETELAIGQYIDENVYSEVELGSSQGAQINLNLDLNQNLTVRGSASTEGETGLGLFWRKDY